jgi:hypothetical protein
MAKIVDETGAVIHEGDYNEMRRAFEYMTTPGWVLAEKRGYNMNDLYSLNAKYWVKFVGKLNLIV